jgi:multidrug efflux pump subunit AcrB
MKMVNLTNRFRRQQIASEVEEEFQFHLDMLEDKYALSGMSANEAKAAASRRFGNLERFKQECVNITRRNSLLRSVLKTSTILVALTGLAIHILGSDFKVARIGHVLIAIAILGRLLLYVRGLVPTTFLPRTDERFLSVVTDTPKDART